MRILLIEDDKDLCETLRFQLEQEGFSVDISNDGEEGLQYIRQQAHDLILLDRMLPNLDGVQILRATRQETISTPIILVTALGSLNDRVDGLETGADDYIVKPFAFRELLARIKTVCRRPRQLSSDFLIAYGDIEYNSEEKTLTSKCLGCTLSKKEGDLMELFIKNPQKILSRSILLSRVWGPYAEVEEGNLDNYIYFLRKRLAFLKSSLEITTVRGIGYRMEQKNV